MALKVLVVDDMILFRKVVSDALSSLPGVEVVGTANNGKIALQRIETHKPDLMTLDLEMPELDGLGVLREIKARRLPVGTVVLSSLTMQGGELTMKALEAGAFDFVLKPAGGTLDQNREAIKNALAPILKAFLHRQGVRQILQSRPNPLPAPAPPPPPPARPAPAPNLKSVGERMEQLINGHARPEMVVLGISTGGPAALMSMLPQLPADLGVPVLIVQHMPPTFTRSLAGSLDARCALHVKEAEEGEPALPGVAYIAPGGRHMKLAPAAEDGRKIIRITDDPPENNCRPAVDTLFRSVALHYPGRATAVVMTGMGNDGALGVKLIKRGGGATIAQDEESCIVFGMPREAIATGAIDVVAPLDRIASEIIKAVR